MGKLLNSVAVQSACIETEYLPSEDYSLKNLPFIMAPSKESGALKELFEGFAKAFPENGDPYLSRAIYDQVHKAAAEAPGVSYEDVVVADRPCIWIRPHDASEKHVVLFMHGQFVRQLRHHSLVYWADV